MEEESETESEQSMDSEELGSRAGSPQMHLWGATWVVGGLLASLSTP